MTAGGPPIVIRTWHSNKSVDEGPEGHDSAVLAMPEEMYVGRGSQRALAANAFVAWLRPVLEQMAANLGRALHHADVRMSSDPAVVLELASMHDCDFCREQMEKVDAFMAEHPGVELIVAQMWWVA